ncbi:MAG: DTW domain-containing protein [Polyangiaceae bacterium]|nr:DTW domain-containing protein [Polyangiaceae bacterium]
MRSRTDPALAGRCPRCWLVRAYCICSEIPTLTTPVEIVVVRHRIEAWRSSGTARLLALAVPSVRLVEYGIDVGVADAELAGLIALDQAASALLFPDGGTLITTAPTPRRLIVPDGTWRETRRMLRRLPSTWGLSRRTLPPDQHVAPLRLRRAPGAATRSTIEAVGDALALLGDSGTGDALRRIFRRFTLEGLRARGALYYRTLPGGDLGSDETGLVPKD